MGFTGNYLLKTRKYLSTWKGSNNNISGMHCTCRKWYHITILEMESVCHMFNCILDFIWQTDDIELIKYGVAWPGSNPFQTTRFHSSPPTGTANASWNICIDAFCVSETIIIDSFFNRSSNNKEMTLDQETEWRDEIGYSYIYFHICCEHERKTQIQYST